MDVKQSSVLTYEIYVSGRVQGVGYRYFTRKTAASLKVTGFVKNLPDGRVFVTAQGTKENLKQFIDYLKEGPAFARVENIQMNQIDHTTKSFSSFEIAF